jgi:SNF2 family DNA or RNA helicase
LITRHPPWKHQQAAYDFITRRDHGGLLAMEMGTGKTKVAIDLIQNNPIRRVLIACPKSVIPVWAKEVAKHAADPSDFFVLPVEGHSVHRRTVQLAQAVRAKIKAKHIVVVVNYEAAWREPLRSWLLEVPWDIAIGDESHRIKAPGGKASTFFARLRDRVGFSLGLSGTPMPHSPLDLYAQYRFLDPRVFGTRVDAFKGRYCFLGGFSGREIIGWQNLDELHEKMYSIAFRVGPEVLDLPPEVDEERYVELEPQARKHYRELQKEFMTQLAGGVISAKNAAVKALYLQRIAGGWLKHEDQRYEQVSRAKLHLLADTLEDLPHREPVVVFCRFHREMDGLHELCHALDRPTSELSGRADTLAGWQAGRTSVLLVQIQKSEGVDFTRSRYAVYYSQGVSLGDYKQSRRRISRPGQTAAHTTFIHLIARHTVDEQIYRGFANNEEIIQWVQRDGLAA